MEDVRDAERRAGNAKKAREAAEQLFPGEKWITAAEGIYLSPRRPVGKNSKISRSIFKYIAIPHKPDTKKTSFIVAYHPHPSLLPK